MDEFNYAFFCKRYLSYCVSTNLYSYQREGVNKKKTISFGHGGPGLNPCPQQIVF